MEQLHHMYAGVQQQLMGGMTARRTRGSVGSLDGGRIFNDAIAWISQQKVKGSHKDPPKWAVCGHIDSGRRKTSWRPLWEASPPPKHVILWFKG